MLECALAVFQSAPVILQANITPGGSSFKMAEALLLEKKCTGHADETRICERLTDFELLLSVNEWTGEKAA